MPQIVVVTDSPQSSGRVVYRERVSSRCMESSHFSGQLLERVGWAVGDADVIEHEAKAHTPAPSRHPAQEAAPSPEPPPEPIWAPELAEPLPIHRVMAR